MQYRHVQVIDGKGGLRGIAVDGNGQLYAAGDSEIKVFDGGGRVRRRWPTARPAHAVTVASDGAVRRIAGQNAVSGEADSRHAAEQFLIPPGVEKPSATVENLDLAELAGVYRAVVCHGDRVRRPGGGPAPLQPACGIE